MSLFERIATKVLQIAGELSESVILCSFLMCVFALVSIIATRGIISSLLEMHRSKSALKKLYKNYSFGQKVLLKHAWQDCLHAKRFCRRLIVCHHCILGIFFFELLLAVFSNIWVTLMPFIAWYTLAFCVCIFIPICLLNFMLDRYPFQKWKHEFRFRKYHNTSNHESLW